MSAIFIAPYPPASIVEAIPSEDWALFIRSWLVLTRRLLTLPVETFNAPEQTSFICAFLDSYVRNVPLNGRKDSQHAESMSLRRQCFLLVHRTLATVRPIPEQLIDFYFLARLSLLCGKNASLRTLLQDLWVEQQLAKNKSFLRLRTSLASLLDSGKETSDLAELLDSASALAKVVQPFGEFMLTGSDLIDSAVQSFERSKSVIIQEKTIVMMYIFFKDLMTMRKAQPSFILDLLYNVQSTSLMKSIVKRTPFISQFQRYLESEMADNKRARPLLELFGSYRPAMNGKPKRLVRRRIDKGKSRARSHEANRTAGIVHAHRLSLVSQIQDLFPELGSGFIVKLLDEYGDDVEQVTAHLLDDTLPLHLQSVDRAEQLAEGMNPREDSYGEGLSDIKSPHAPEPLPPRRNIHEDDDFDRLTVDTSRIHLGRKDADLSADKMLETKRPASHKAAILSSLAAFDSDDDERDDTYDVADVGGTVDTTFADSDTEKKQDINEAALFNVYKVNPGAFNRDAETRRGRIRSDVKANTGMTDEAIEGWAVMLKRDPKQLQRLERTMEMSEGFQQRGLAGTSWKANLDSEDTEDSDFQSSGRGGASTQGRRDPNMRGPTGDRAGPADPKQKTANKGSRANHNRRNQRAKKMARGGGLVG